ncbi:MAG: hypothetical protein Q4Q23_06980 [Methanobacteriaceae archaeon]|nr:hypothetical protein [Methanobacteriaceae archaeon]
MNTKKILLIFLLINIFVLTIGTLSATDNTTTDISKNIKSNNTYNEHALIQDTNNKLNDKNTTLKTENKKIETYTNPKTNQKDNILNIQTTIKDKNNKTVNNGKIVIKINDKTYSSFNITNNTTSTDFIIPPSWSGKKINLTSIYGENNKYNFNQINTTIQLDKFEIAPVNETEANSSSCCSVMLQISNKDTAMAFRRDSTYQATLTISKQSWYGTTITRQSKSTGGYFTHAIITQSGWTIGFGGADNTNTNKKIENLAGTMVSKNSITTSYINQVYSLVRSLGVGHFVIKTPDGRLGVAIFNKKGTQFVSKLSKGEFVSVPNSVTYYRRGSYSNFDKNPVNAIIKIAGTDKFGVNRRDITTFYQHTISNSKKVLNVYATNDDGKLSGRHTAKLVDPINIYGKNIRTSSLPLLPNKLLIGSVNYLTLDSTTITTVNNITSKSGDKIDLTATIKDIKGNNIQNGKVLFKINGKTLGFSNITNGKSIYHYNIPQNFQGKNYTITAIFKENNDFQESKSNGILTLIKTPIHVKITPITGKVGQKINLSAQITDLNNKSVKDGLISFKLNGKTITRVKVVNGTATYTYIIPNNYKTKNYNLTAVYGVTKTYLRSENSTILTIK